MSTLKGNWFEYVFIKKAKPYLFILFLCVLTSAALGWKIPALTSSLSKNYNSELLFYQSIKSLVFLFLAIYVNRVLYQVMSNLFVKELIQNVRSKCYRVWLLSYDLKSGGDDDEKYPLGEVNARIMSDTEAIRELITSGAIGIFIDIFFVVSCLLGFLQINTFSGAVIGVAELIAASVLIWGSKYMRTVFTSVRESRGRVSQSISNVVGGMEEAYYNPHNSFASQTGKRSFDDYLDKILKSNIWDAGFYSIAESLYPILLILVILIFPYSGITEAAVIFAIVDLIQRSIGPIKDISGKIANIQRASTGVDRFHQFVSDFSAKPSSIVGKKADAFDLDHMEININTFSYDVKKNEADNEEVGDAKTEPFTLKDIKFTVQTNQLIGLVGLSGCGKSTLLNILAANIYLKEGSVALHSEGQKILNYPGNTLDDIIAYREQVGIVSQESHIFKNTLAFNISLGSHDGPELLAFWQWIVGKIPYLQNWGLKLSDEVYRSDLSLGQQQLISGIRACFLKKPVILFDEISSGLDSDLEYALREVMLVLQKQSVIIIVTHRLETIREANNILVMDKGIIVASGTHHKLAESSPEYCRFIEEMAQKEV
jgi:ATP-binding cassette subfamily B multidrug efflux pump